MLPAVLLSIAVYAAPVADSHEEVMKDVIQVVTEVCDVMDQVKDKATAEANKAKLKTLEAKLDDLKKRNDKLGPPTQEVQKKISEQYLAKFLTLLPRMQAVQKKLETTDIKAALGDLKLSPK